MIRWLVLLTCWYPIWILILFFIQDHIIFARDWATGSWREKPFPAAEELTLEVAADTTVAGWFAPAPRRERAVPAPTVVYFHGNAEIIDDQYGVVASYRQLGCSVFLPEYRGYGRSEGTPTRDDIRNDCLRFIDMLIQRGQADPSRLVYHGYSLGGAIAADVAEQRPPTALILQATFTSTEDMAHRFLAPGFLVRHRYRTDRIVSQLDIPVLILHGTNDAVVPVAHGRRLRDLARQGTYMEYPCGHCTIPHPIKTPTYWRDIEAFLLRCGVLEPQ